MELKGTVLTAEEAFDLVGDKTITDNSEELKAEEAKKLVK